MASGLVTCPNCGTRVLPTSDDSCPACRRYKFRGDEAPAAALQIPAPARPAPDLRQAAVLHWQTVVLLGAFVGLLLARTYIRLTDRGTFAAAGMDRDLLKMLVSVSMIAVIVLLGMSARKLGAVIGLSRWLNPFTLLKESMGYFEDHKVPVGFLGPRMRDVPAKPTQVEEPRGRPTRG